jgi:hypothetical protein
VAVRPSAETEHAVVRRQWSSLPAALGDDEFAARREAHGARELAVVGGLREGVREELVDVSLAVAVRVAQAPDAVAIEDVYLLVPDRERQRLVKAGGEALPFDCAGWLMKAAYHPHVAVERDDDACSVLRNWMSRAHVAAPGIFDRQREVVHDVRAK